MLPRATIKAIRLLVTGIQDGLGRGAAIDAHQQFLGLGFFDAVGEAFDFVFVADGFGERKA